MILTVALHIATGVVLSVAALLVLYRIVRGPTILDRMIASDVMVTTVMLVLCVEMVIDGHTRTLPVVLVLAGTAVFGSIAVARYVSKQDRTKDADPAADMEVGSGS
jgi:multicomponent Na+:H+ antiporter subunit F